jgi:hypothetical protein
LFSQVALRINLSPPLARGARIDIQPNRERECAPPDAGIADKYISSFTSRPHFVRGSYFHYIYCIENSKYISLCRGHVSIFHSVFIDFRPESRLQIVFRTCLLVDTCHAIRVPADHGLIGSVLLLHSGLCFNSVTF